MSECVKRTCNCDNCRKELSEETMSHPPETGKSDPLKPPLSLLTKLGTLAVHADEMLSVKGHPFDRIALEAALHDPEVVTWIKAMGVYMPVKR